MRLKPEQQYLKRIDKDNTAAKANGINRSELMLRPKHQEHIRHPWQKFTKGPIHVTKKFLTS